MFGTMKNLLGQIGESKREADTIPPMEANLINNNNNNDNLL